MSLRHWGLALLIVLAWGVNFVVIRFGLDELPPLLLGGLRFALVAFPALLFIKPPNLPLKWLLAYGLTISFGQFALLFSAMYVGMPAGLASLVLQSQMLFTMLFALMLLGERWRLPQLLSLIVASSGLALLATKTPADEMTLAGFLLTIAAAASWGMGNIVNRRIGQLGGVNLMSLVVWGALVPPIPFLLLSLWLEGPELILSSLNQMGLKSVGSLLYLALVATLFGYGSWAFLMRHYPASTVAPLTLLVPVVGLITAWLVLDEGLSLIQLAGIALILLGLMINVFGDRLRFRAMRRAVADDLHNAGKGR
ncbi:EamA family transporter [Marinobacterium sp. D7]|uniref:EamA family transporter n=1 Tax=Marinobacterium ramblicola TaxID=2849041 RepID=UPI001C2DE1AB|nr:EamA family transporter [Marinobacterium ramblicola]MBV1790586.1 EamA family transporter [Marinobacterium ramblicola]